MTIACCDIGGRWVLPDKPDRELNVFLRRRRRLNMAMQRGENVKPRFFKLPSKWHIQRLASEFDEFSWREVKNFGEKFRQ